MRDLQSLILEQFNRFARPGERSNPMINLPEERAGLLLVFQPYDRISYALVVDSERPMHILDVVRNP